MKISVDIRHIHVYIRYMEETPMTNMEAVKLIDETARFFIWGGPNDKTGWVKGNGWETKITYSEDRAWQAAVELIAALPAKEAA